MTPRDPAESFVKSLTQSQNRLYGYIYSLIGDHHRAADVLQECNLVLWRRAKDFRAGGDFIPWAFGIARFQVMAHLRDKGRERKQLLNPDLAELMFSELEEEALHFDELQAALRRCVNKLPKRSRELVDQYYFRRISIQKIAEVTERNLSAVKVALFRVRQGLKRCVDRELGNAT